MKKPLIIAFLSMIFLSNVSAEENSQKMCFTIANTSEGRTLTDYDVSCGLDVKIPESVQVIGENAFHRSGIKSVIIPDSVTQIKSSAFYGNDLEEVHLPNSVISIGERSFELNEKIKDIILPKNLKFLGRRSFADTSINAITIPESVEYVDAFVFADTPLSQVTILNPQQIIGTKLINNYAFWFCDCSTIMFSKSNFHFILPEETKKSIEENPYLIDRLFLWKSATDLTIQYF